MAKKKSSPKKKSACKKPCSKKCEPKQIIEEIPVVNPPQSKTNIFLQMMKKAFGYD
jgi:hypothetical protein